MKQRELGELVGFTDGAANRIAQYESGFRVRYFMLSLYHIREKNQQFNNIYVKSLTRILRRCIINITDMM